MAEAHGVGSSIPMVSYTGLSQEDLETSMTSFYEYLAKQHKLDNDHDDLSDQNNQELHKQAARRVYDAYQDFYECATGEFGGYNPFPGMVEHPPEQVAIALGVHEIQE